MLEIDFRNVNTLFVDKFGRKSGIFIIRKPKDITSHDVVDIVRRKLGTRKVGHAGTLDPFATGMMIILVGNYTKKTEQLINLDKAYKGRIILGIGTDSGDIEGEVIGTQGPKFFDTNEINKCLAEFSGEYKQFVPIFSSVKVSGFKLRELARSSESFEIYSKEDKNFARFKFSPLEKLNRKLREKIIDNEIIIEIPSKVVNLKTQLLHTGEITSEPIKNLKEASDKKYQYIDIQVDCSKGTYIRQLAFDIGEKLKIPATLIELERIRIGEIQSNAVIDIAEFENLEFES